MSNRRAQDERIEGTPDGANAITAIMDVPDTPTIGTATDNGDLSASITFTAPTTGGTASTYTVTSTPGSITGTGATSPVTVSGLSVDTSYTFKVKGSTSSGVFGPESSASNSVTMAMPIPGAYDALAVATLSTSASSITFSGIPTGYKHLQLRWVAKTDRTETDDVVYMSFNSNTASNYSWHFLRGNGSATLSSASTSTSNIAIQYGATGSSGATNIFAGVIVDILEYNNTNVNKTVRSLQGMDLNGSGWVYLQSGNWRSTSPITSITLDQQYGSNFTQFTQVALYGVK
jgi:hypothetical protein